jgi:hypothetical protein
MSDLFPWLNQNAGAVGIPLAIGLPVLAAAWTFVRYLGLKTKELHHERFKIYHGLIRQLVEPEAAEASMRLDRQIAVAFELRHFPEYFELTHRLLEGLCRTWADPRVVRLTDEMRRTMDYIAARSIVRPEPAPPPTSDADAP